METLLTDGLAAHRLTQLIVQDQIFDRPRARLNQAFHEAGWTWGNDLLRCPYCVSIWVGAGVVAARLVAPRAWRHVARALAASDIAGIVTSVV